MGALWYESIGGCALLIRPTIGPQVWRRGGRVDKRSASTSASVSIHQSILHNTVESVFIDEKMAGKMASRRAAGPGGAVCLASRGSPGGGGGPGNGRPRGAAPGRPLSDETDHRRRNRGREGTRS